MTKNRANTQFLEDVLSGLQAPQKHLSSKYFYDKAGDKLFQRIMNLDEYYLTNKEMEIFQHQKDQILRGIGKNDPFRIIELVFALGTYIKVLYFLVKTSIPW